MDEHGLWGGRDGGGAQVWTGIYWGLMGLAGRNRAFGEFGGRVWGGTGLWVDGLGGKFGLRNKK